MNKSRHRRPQRRSERPEAPGDRTIASVDVLLVVGALAVGIVIGLAVAGRLLRRRPSVAAEAVAGPVAGPGPDLRSLPAQVVSALGEGVVVVNRDHEVLLVNGAARALGALSGDRLAHDGLRQLAYAALNGGPVTTGSVELPRGYLGREVLTVGVSAVPLGPAERGRVQAVALLLSDLTETRRLEAVRRDFVANVSHELKTPVGALTLLAEAVQEAADDPEAVQRFAGRMQHEGQRLGRLVGELIALSRVQGADALPERHPIDVDHLLADAVDRSRLPAERAGITLVAAPAAGLTVFGDDVQLATAVANLVDNAVSYSPGGTRVVVTARAVPASPERASCVEIVVADQGIGIADSDLDRIFERFYRVDPARSRATGGTGLGLAIVKHVVTNHGGTVDAWSSEGAGSTFTIRLPDTASTTSAPPPSITALPTTTSSATTSSTTTSSATTSSTPPPATTTSSTTTSSTATPSTTTSSATPPTSSPTAAGTSPARRHPIEEEVS
jgi:two-component system, OmpR family, sensor histidine kinase SenX3